MKTDFTLQWNNKKRALGPPASSKAGDWVVLEQDELEEFIGYDHLETRVKITRYRKMTTAKEGDFYQLVFNLTLSILKVEDKLATKVI